MVYAPWFLLDQLLRSSAATLLMSFSLYSCCSDLLARPAHLTKIIDLDPTDNHVNPQTEAFNPTVLNDWSPTKRKRGLTYQQKSCPPNYVYNDSFCKPYTSPQAFTVSCNTPYGQSVEWFHGECQSNQICVSINTQTVDAFAAKHAAYCVDYEYFSSLAKVYVKEGSAKAGSIISQINFNAGQRASLEIEQLSVAAVLTGQDNHTSIFAQDMKIEADGVTKEYSWAPAS